MAVETCTRCGQPLIHGVCPSGHPQRSARKHRRRSRRIAALTTLFLILGGLGYAGLVWYPTWAAADVLGPASDDYEDALAEFGAMVSPFRAESGAVSDALGVLELADPTREALSQARTSLEAETLTSLPIVGSRPALFLARDVRERMLEFYVAALETVADLEAVARYLVELDPLLLELENLEAALGPAGPRDIAAVAAAARPISNQLAADLRALTPPEELGALHARLEAVVNAILTDVAELEELGGASRLALAFIRDINHQVGTFRAEARGAGIEVLEEGLGDRLGTLERETATIRQGLLELVDQGVDGLTIPSELSLLPNA